MTHQPLTKAEREELRKIIAEARDVCHCGQYVDEHTVSDNHAALAMDTQESDRLTAASLEAMPRLLADLDATEAEHDTLRSTHAETNLQWAADLAKANAEREAFRAMAHLLATDNAFAVRTKGGGVGFNILCSDTFAWACADAEAIDISQAPEVWKLYQDGGWQAVALWVQEKRGGEKFIKPVEEMIERSKAILAERDALKAKLDDPRRVLIHETEVVATKEEIAKLKKELADLSEADEELHACRALVNATSENLSVDLERMVDDLAEANEKAARSEKDAHSWCELYTDTKAKLAALVDSCRSAETILGNMAKETGRTFGRWEIHHEPLRNDAQRMLPSFRSAIEKAKAVSYGDEIDKIAGSELRAVMESVDKWLDGDDLTANPATRAAKAREVAMQWGETLNATLAATQAERDTLKAKLAALAKAADPFACDQGCDAVHHPVKDRHDQRDNCPVVARLRVAIAAARGGAQ